MLKRGPTVVSEVKCRKKHFYKIRSHGPTDQDFDIIWRFYPRGSNPGFHSTQPIELPLDCGWYLMKRLIDVIRSPAVILLAGYRGIPGSIPGDKISRLHQKRERKRERERERKREGEKREPEVERERASERDRDRERKREKERETYRGHPRIYEERSTNPHWSRRLWQNLLQWDPKRMTDSIITNHSQTKITQ